MITTSILTTGIGMVVGIVKDLLLSSMKHKQAREELLLRKAGLVLEDRQQARDLKGPGISFTRRIVTFALTFLICIPGIMVLIDPNFVINIPITETKDGFSFLFFSSGPTETTKYITLTGYTYLISLLDFYGLIIGYYFGSGGTHTRH